MYTIEHPWKYHYLKEWSETTKRREETKTDSERDGVWLGLLSYLESERTDSVHMKL
jgi:hypothetical protein